MKLMAVAHFIPGRFLTNSTLPMAPVGGSAADADGAAAARTAAAAARTCSTRMNPSLGSNEGNLANKTKAASAPGAMASPRGVPGNVAKHGDGDPRRLP